MSFAVLKTPRLWIAIAAVAIVVAFRTTEFGNLLSFDTLRAYRGALVGWVEGNIPVASSVYVLAYIGVVALSLPGAAFLTLAGGFLFGAALGTLLTAIGATVGATFVFLFAKFLFGDRVVERLGTQYPNLVEGVRENAWSYLLVLRFVPLFPFFLVNLIAAIVGIKLSTYVLTTFFGILPGTAVFSLSGAGLGSILDQGENFSIGAVLTPTVLSALVGLAALSLAAIPIRKRLKKLSITEAPPHGSLPSQGLPHRRIADFLDDELQRALSD
jgi:uncharacterized membrane protein YdjX (TVP38/TMEM64 family)